MRDLFSKLISWLFFFGKGFFTIIGLSISVLGLIFGALVVLMFLDPAAGIFQLFLATYQIENQSGKPILVTPLHNYRQGPQYYIPFRCREPNTGKFRETPPSQRIPFEAGEVASISWDSDSGYPVFFLIREKNGTNTFILDLFSPKTLAGNKTGNRYCIPPLGLLPLAPKNFLPGFDGETITWVPPKEVAAALASGS